MINKSVNDHFSKQTHILDIGNIRADPCDPLKIRVRILFECVFSFNADL